MKDTLQNLNNLYFLRYPHQQLPSINKILISIYIRNCYLQNKYLPPIVLSKYKSNHHQKYLPKNLYFFGSSGFRC